MQFFFQQGGPYLSSRKAANSASLLSPYKSSSSLHLWNDAPIFILVFSLARSNSFFSHCCSSSVFLFLLFDVGNGGAFCCSVASLPSFTVWVWFDQVRVGTARGRGTAQYVLCKERRLPAAYTWAWLTLGSWQTSICPQHSNRFITTINYNIDNHNKYTQVANHLTDGLMQTDSLSGHCCTRRGNWLNILWKQSCWMLTTASFFDIWNFYMVQHKKNPLCHRK